MSRLFELQPSQSDETPGEVFEELLARAMDAIWDRDTGHAATTTERLSAEYRARFKAAMERSR